jgi:hypothetical protein
MKKLAILSAVAGALAVAGCGSDAAGSGAWTREHEELKLKLSREHGQRGSDGTQYWCAKSAVPAVERARNAKQFDRALRDNCARWTTPL